MSMHRTAPLTVLLVATLSLAPRLAAAQESGDPFAGHELAQRWCSGCHLVDPVIQKQGSDAVPSFQAIANMKSTTAAMLAVFLSTPHARMPDWQLSRQDIANVSAYILSLRKN
jgi:mono/diheme cytochrome c family protein